MQYRENMLRRGLIPLLAAFALFAASEPEPWTATDLLQPKTLADQLRSDGAKPHVFSVAFSVLYRNRHITGSEFAGPGRDPEGIAALKKAVSGLPKDAEIVRYTKLHVLLLPTNFATDWAQKGYPSEPPPQ